MIYVKILPLLIVSMVCIAQERFEEIQVPHYGPYFKQWEDKARKGDPIAMLELLEWTAGVYNANTDLPLKPVGVCVKWQPNAEKLIQEKVKERADKGDVIAMRRMGAFALQNPTAMAYLRRAAETGDPYAMRDLARTYKYGDPKQSEMFDKSRRIILQRAQDGDRRALVAILCEVSRGPILKITINGIFEKAVKEKDFHAGVIYYLKATDLMRWQRTPEEDKSVVDWLEQAAQCGEIRAMQELAQLYYHGKHFESSIKVVKNIEQAWKWARAYREAVGCPSPDVDPPKDDYGKAWKKPKTSSEASGSQRK